MVAYIVRSHGFFLTPKIQYMYNTITQEFFVDVKHCSYENFFLGGIVRSGAKRLSYIMCLDPFLCKHTIFVLNTIKGGWVDIAYASYRQFSKLPESIDNYRLDLKSDEM